MKSTIILIDDPSKINEITKYAKNDNTKIFSLNYDTHKTLEMHSIIHEIGDNYIDDTDLDALDIFLVHLTKNWYLDYKIKDYLTYDSLNIGKLLEMEILQYFTSFLLEIKSSIEIIKKEKPNSIIAITKINSFLEQYCKKLNTDFLNIVTLEKDTLPTDNLLFKFNIGIFTPSIKISRKQFLSIKNCFEKIIYDLLNFYTSRKRLSQKSILFFDFNSVNYEDLLNEFNKSDYRIVLLNIRRPSIWNLKSLKIIIQNKIEIINLQKLKNKISFELENDTKKFISNIELLWKKDEYFEKIFSFDNVSFWHSIKKSFMPIIMSRSKESISRILLFKSLLNSHDFSAILEWAETGQEEGEIIHVAKQKHIKTIFVQHAMMQISEGHVKFGSFLSHLSYPLQSDMQLVWGDSAKNFCSTKKSNKNVIAIGSPRHDKFFNHKKISVKPVILFAPTGPSGISCKNSTAKKIIEFYDIIKETCKIISNIPSKECIIKPHPSPTFSNDVIDIAKSVSNKIKITFTSDILDLINQCEILITTNNSTIAVEAMMLGKPVISLQSEDWSLNEDIVVSNAILSITNTSQLKNLIDKILFDEKFKNELLNNSKVFLSKHFSNHGEASNQIPDILEKYLYKL